LHLIAALIACARPTPIEVDWPESGCASSHEPAAGAASVSLESPRLLTPDGTELAAGVMTPGAGCWPAVMLIPPGFESALIDLQGQAEEVAEAGVVVMAFDPRGRGESEGEEDMNGPVQQDDLAAALSWLAAREEVDPARVYLRSRSYGIATSLGALDRHRQVDPAGLMDIEGPSSMPEDLDRALGVGPLWDEAPDDDPGWWAARSPDAHAHALRGDYLRLQGGYDHALGGYLGHAATLLNGVTAAASARLHGETDPSGDGDWTEDEVRALAWEGTARWSDPQAAALLLALIAGR